MGRDFKAGQMVGVLRGWGFFWLEVKLSFVYFLCCLLVRAIKLISIHSALSNHACHKIIPKFIYPHVHRNLSLLTTKIPLIVLMATLMTLVDKPASF